MQEIKELNQYRTYLNKISEEYEIDYKTMEVLNLYLKFRTSNKFKNIYNEKYIRVKKDLKKEKRKKIKEHNRWVYNGSIIYTNENKEHNTSLIKKDIHSLTNENGNIDILISTEELKEIFELKTNLINKLEEEIKSIKKEIKYVCYIKSTMDENKYSLKLEENYKRFEKDEISKEIDEEFWKIYEEFYNKKLLFTEFMINKHIKILKHRETKEKYSEIKDELKKIYNKIKNNEKEYIKNNMTNMALKVKDIIQYGVIDTKELNEMLIITEKLEKHKDEINSICIGKELRNLFDNTKVYMVNNRKAYINEIKELINELKLIQVDTTEEEIRKGLGIVIYYTNGIKIEKDAIYDATNTKELNENIERAIEIIKNKKEFYEKIDSIKLFNSNEYKDNYEDSIKPDIKLKDAINYLTENKVNIENKEILQIIQEIEFSNKSSKMGYSITIDQAKELRKEYFKCKKIVKEEFEGISVIDIDPIYKVYNVISVLKDEIKCLKYNEQEIKTIKFEKAILMKEININAKEKINLVEKIKEKLKKIDESKITDIEFVGKTIGIKLENIDYKCIYNKLQINKTNRKMMLMLEISKKIDEIKEYEIEETNIDLEDDEIGFINQHKEAIESKKIIYRKKENDKTAIIGRTSSEKFIIKLNNFFVIKEIIITDVKNEVETKYNTIISMDKESLKVADICTKKSIYYDDYINSIGYNDKEFKKMCADLGLNIEKLNNAYIELTKDKKIEKSLVNKIKKSIILAEVIKEVGIDKFK